MEKTDSYRPTLTALQRSLIALVFGGLIWFVTAGRYSWQIRLLLAWLAYALIVLSLIWVIIGWADTRQTAQREDESRTAIYLLTVVGAMFSLFGVIALLGSMHGLSAWETTRHVALSSLTVVCSWTLMHSVFILHYAHIYYNPGSDAVVGGLEFPGNEPPDYLDFAYFSFVIGMTYQVSDMSISMKRLRRLNLLHSLLSFVFNVLIITLTINFVTSIL